MTISRAAPATSPGFPAVPAMLLATLSVEGGAAMAKSMFPVLGATTTLSLRVGLSALLLILLFRPFRRRVTPAQWRALIPYGLALGAMNLLFYLALARIPLGLAVTLEFVGPLLLGLFGSRRATDLLWAVLAGLGVALCAPWGGQTFDLMGALLALLAGACWAAYVITGGHVSRARPGGDGVALGLLVAAALILPLSGLVAVTGQGQDSGWLHLTPGLLLTGLGVAVMSSALPYSLEMLALQQLSARTFSVLLSLSPAVAALCGVLFLQEHLNPVQWTAVGMVVVASIGATLNTPAHSH